MSETELYLDCWVDWGGKISNAQVFENGSYSCELLVGDESLEHFDGSVKVYFDKEPVIDPGKYVRILGKISLEGSEICLRGRAVYQSVYNK